MIPLHYHKFYIVSYTQFFLLMQHPIKDCICYIIFLKQSSIDIRPHTITGGTNAK